MKISTSNYLSCFAALFAVLCFLFLPVLDFSGFRLGTFSGLDALQKKVGFVYWLFLIVPIVSQALLWRVQSRQHRLFFSCLMLLPALFNFFEMLSDCDWHFDAAKNLLGIGFWFYALAAIVSLFFAVKCEDEESVARRNLCNDEVRSTYTVERLKEVVANPQIYDAALVERCKQELTIRQEAVALKAQVAEFTDEKICGVLRNSEIYSSAIVYCCQLEQARRKKLNEPLRESLVEDASVANSVLEKSVSKDNNKSSLFWAIHGIILLLVVLYMIFLK
ncbi:MAG: hypothetical protein E7070_02365 [Bacteroidales bacterium]|nr:hypothetical protein [Bacteroidales bacterium]